jgi:hypothetical protein
MFEAIIDVLMDMTAFIKVETKAYKILARNAELLLEHLGEMVHDLFASGLKNALEFECQVYSSTSNHFVFAHYEEGGREYEGSHLYGIKTRGKLRLVVASPAKYEKFSLQDVLTASYLRFENEVNFLNRELRIFSLLHLNPDILKVFVFN